MVVFRNVDASVDDDVRSWPYEALVACIEQGLVPDWQPIFTEIRKNPWGEVARKVESYVNTGDDSAAAQLFSLALHRAREDYDHSDREEVARRVRKAIQSSGLTSAAFADYIGTSASRLSTYASGKVTPSAALFLRMERISKLLAEKNGKY